MGRAKRHMQYNRSFVNIVPTFGKKKGPDVNSQILCNPGFPPPEPPSASGWAQGAGPGAQRAFKDRM